MRSGDHIIVGLSGVSLPHHFRSSEMMVLMTDFSVERDRWGRPLLFPPEGGRPVPYTRPSTMAKWLDSQAGLINWKASMAMIGMAQSKPIQARVAAIVAKSVDNPYRENRDALKGLVESATQVAQAQGRADFGTAIHEFTELVDSGTLDWSFVPAGLRSTLEAYRETISGFDVIDSEVFVAVDEEIDGTPLRGAGSLDRLILHPQLGVCVADIKTGPDEPKYPLGVTTQVSIYSRGLRYRDTRFSGSPQFDDGTPNPDGSAWRKPLHETLNREVGILIHLPLNAGRCDLYALDLSRGWDSLSLGHRVQKARRSPKLEKL